MRIYQNYSPSQGANASFEITFFIQKNTSKLLKDFLLDLKFFNPECILGANDPPVSLRYRDLSPTASGNFPVLHNYEPNRIKRTQDSRPRHSRSSTGTSSVTDIWLVTPTVCQKFLRNSSGKTYSPPAQMGLGYLDRQDGWSGMSFFGQFGC